MPFVIPSFDEVRTLLLAAMSGRFPNANLNQRSSLYKMISAFALAATDVNYNLSQVQLDLMPDTAEGDFLRRWATIYGLTPKGASTSAATAGLRVFGDVAAIIPNNEPMIHPPSGLLFETRSAGAVAASGFADVDVASTSTGVQTNLEVGQELQFLTTPTGLEANARIVVEMTSATDQELDDALRERLLNRIGQPAAGGNRNDYEQFLLAAAPYVATGYVYPGRNGLGTVDLAALKSGSGSTRALDAGERNEVFLSVDAERPVSATIRVLDTVAASQDVEVTVVPENDPQYAFDWDDSVGLQVLLYTSATRTLQFNIDRPASMAVGDRIIVRSTTGSTGKEYVIESFVSTDSVVITESHAEGWVTGDDVYSGSPITAGIRDGIIALFDALGPANPDAIGYGPWEGNLRISTLFETVQLATGVLDSTIVTPVANVEANDPAFPANSTIEFLVPGEIIVRKQ